MPADRAERAFRAQSYQREPTSIRASVQVFAPRARLIRAARLFVPLFLGGAVATVIPPHWPGLTLVVIACVQGLRRLRQIELIENLAGPCPSCLADVELPIPRRQRFPATVRCPSCGEFAQLVA